MRAVDCHKATTETKQLLEPFSGEDLFGPVPGVGGGLPFRGPSHEE
jgi:hypothetical protein